MTHSEIIKYCLEKPGAFLDYPFGPDITIVKVAGAGCASRTFAQLLVLRGEPIATFSCEAIMGTFYRTAFPGVVTRGYHCPPVQQPYFNTVKLDGSLPDDEILRMADHAYAAVLKKLPKYAQRALEASSDEA